MYRQILIANEQRSLQRIFWRDDPDQELKCYELKTVTYGTASAPYLATRCLYQLAVNHETSNPIASNVIKQDFYMDDLLTGSNSMADLLKIQVDVSSILASAGFELRKWLSNNSDIMRAIQVDHNLESSIIQIGENQENKTLGIYWNSSLDLIQFSIQNISLSGPITKRAILSIISQVFDPLGLLGPVIVVAKIIMQHLWQAKLSWDEAVPQNIYSEWRHFCDSLHLLNDIKAPRWVLKDDAISIELHAFSDSSETAFGSCVYIRCKTNNGEYTSNLLCAKSRVAPLRKVTLPRLELCAAHLLANLVQKVRDSMGISFDKFYYWCDSTITLSWIKSPANRWKTFVANRVSDIQELTNMDDWYHVRSEDNPADLLSRGMNASQILTSNLWWEGPQWLKQDERSWHNDNFDNNSKGSDIPEQRTVVTLNTSSETEFNLFVKYSNVGKLQRVMAYMLRFSHNVRTTRENRETGPLKPHELKLSLCQLVKISQMQSFPREYSQLENKRPINRKSNLLSLDPFLSEDGVMRVKGRIQNAQCNFEKMHPMILDPKHELTRLILTNEHERLLHCGPQQLLYAIREQFWPISGRNIARSVVRQCIKCFRAKPSSQEYKMGNLPSVRVNQFVPFYNTGVDYAGPILIKNRKTRGPKMIKAYICLFICLSTKAMHLEVVTELSTQAFLAALKRFIARRGRPVAIYSDNGSNFIGADTRLKELSEFFESQSKNIINFLSDDSIAWHFIPPRAPNFGGLWEAGVKSVKFHLKRVVGNVHLHYEDLCTILIQIESILNSRPLCPLSSSPLDNSPLTPAHFLIGRTLTAIPEPSVIDVKESRLTKYQRLQQIIEHFWQRWHKEYLSELQSRSKWTVKPRRPKR